MQRFKRCAWVGLLIFMMWGSALAVTLDQAAAPKTDAGGITGMLKGAGVGAMAGLTLALLGFAKDKEPNKKFDLKAATPTVLIGVALGFFSGWESMDLSKWKEWKETAATVLIGELLLKAGWRNGEPVVGGVIQRLLGKKSGSSSE